MHREAHQREARHVSSQSTFLLSLGRETRSQQARNFGTKAASAGRLPQIMSAARVSIQAPNETDRITFPEGKTRPAIQDPGERGESRQTSSRQTQSPLESSYPCGAWGSTEAKSQSCSQQCSQPGGKKNMRGKKKANKNPIVSPPPRLFKSNGGRTLKKRSRCCRCILVCCS